MYLYSMSIYIYKQHNIALHLPYMPVLVLVCT